MTNNKGDGIVKKGNIPSEILSKISPFDSSLDYHEKNKKLDDLNKKCKNYSEKLDGLYKLKELLEKDVEKLIFDHGGNLDREWSSDDHRCYYRNPDKKTICYSYRDYRTVEDLNRRRKLVSLLETRVYKPVQKISRNLPFPHESVSFFDDKWLIWSKKDQINLLESEIFKTKTFLERSKLEEEDQKEKVESMKDKGILSSEESYKSKQKKKDHLKKEYQEKEKERFDSFFNRKYSWYKPPPKKENTSSRSQDTRNTPIQILNKYGIHNKKEWKEWLRNNHQDKGGNKEDCQKVITVGRELGY